MSSGLRRTRAACSSRSGLPASGPPGSLAGWPPDAPSRESMRQPPPACRVCRFRSQYLSPPQNGISTTSLLSCTMYDSAWSDVALDSVMRSAVRAMPSDSATSRMRSHRAAGMVRLSLQLLTVVGATPQARASAALVGNFTKTLGTGPGDLGLKSGRLASGRSGLRSWRVTAPSVACSILMAVARERRLV